MKRIQKGFTLIELMIVVAIVGILAAIALPAYRDYATKSKFAEAGSLSAAAIKNIQMAFMDGTLSASTNNASLNMGAATDIKGNNVTSVTVAGVDTKSATVTVVMKGFNDADIDGKNVVYTVTCDAGASCQTTMSGSVPAKFLPKGGNAVASSGT
jgi:type IV pilus assembly protein PilA